MGSIAVVAGSSSGIPAIAAVRRALAASPHRGRRAEVVELDGVALGVANDGVPDAWLALVEGRAAVFSGRLDNAAELAAELTRNRVAVDAGNPAALALAALRAWEDAPRRFRGVFACVVVDSGGASCFRDQLGFRTLFYCERPDGFVVATEAKQVAAGAGFPRAPDLAALEDIFYDRPVDGATALRGVRRVPRATVGRLETGRPFAVEPYWDPARLVETARLSVDEAVEGLAQHLEEAVRRCVTGSDAVSLSGGLDSPAVAAFAAPLHVALRGRPLQAVSAVYPEQPSVDESLYIELVAERLGLPLHAYAPSARPLDDVRDWADVLDGPVATLPVPEAAESYRHARDVGATTVLTGEMAEWLLTLRHHLAGHLLLHGRLRAAEALLRSRRTRRLGKRALLRELLLSVAPAAPARAYTRLARWDVRLLPAWLSPDQVGGLGYRPDLRVPARRRWIEAQLRPLRGSLLSIEADDLCAAACGVLPRRPLADVDLWEFCLSLRAETKFPDDVTKTLLRRAMRGRLPDEIVYRRDKTAFDEHYLAVADHDGLRRWILESDYRMPGVDYGLLASRLERRELTVFELGWAHDLARVHAFLSLWA
jgi:asparagine synthase (glutamine-hydrolysing)